MITGNGTFEVANHFVATVSSTGMWFYAGSICGLNTGTATLKNVRSYGSFEYSPLVSNGTKSNTENHSYFGGLAGKNWGTIEQCQYAGKIESAATRVESYYFSSISVLIGGITGIQEKGGVIAACSADATISVADTTGVNVECIGMICAESHGATIRDCLASGRIQHNSVVGKAFIGGILGYNGSEGKVSNCYVTTEIIEEKSGNSAPFYIGGIVGYNSGNCTVKGSCMAGSIASQTSRQYGYIIGAAENGSTCFKCYYSASATIRIGTEMKLVGTCNAGSVKEADALCSAALLSEELCWDASVWKIGNGAPTLKCFE